MIFALFFETSMPKIHNLLKKIRDIVELRAQFREAVDIVCSTSLN